MNKKPFDREEVFELLRNGRKKAMLDYDLRWANLQGANLQGANLQEADLRWANLQEANLQEADLRWANLQGANLQEADLQEADLRWANLQGADLDFSCLPLRCSGLKWKIDKRLACQLAFHLCSMQCDDEEFLKLREFALPFANQFHRTDVERLEPTEAGK